MARRLNITGSIITSQTYMCTGRMDGTASQYYWLYNNITNIHVYREDGWARRLNITVSIITSKTYMCTGRMDGTASQYYWLYNNIKNIHVYREDGWHGVSILLSP